MPRQSRVTTAVRRRILIARGGSKKVCWKILQRETGLGRTRLYQILKEELNRHSALNPKNVHEQIRSGN